jgi:acetyl esterase
MIVRSQEGSINATSKLAMLIAGIALTTQSAIASPNPSTDPRIDPRVRASVTELNKDSSPFWQWPRPKTQDILTALRNKTPEDMSGVTAVEKMIDQEGHIVKLLPEQVASKSGVLLFIHCGAWSLEISKTISSCCAISSFGSGQIGVFVEYTPYPAAKYPTRMDQSYAALKWGAAHAGEFGADGSPIAAGPGPPPYQAGFIADADCRHDDR